MRDLLMYIIRKTRLVSIIVLCICSANVSGYEVVTHGFLTRASINQSVLKSPDSNPLEDFGLTADIESNSQLFTDSKGEM